MLVTKATAAPAQHADGEHRGETAEHGEFAMREIDDPQYAEHQRKPDRQQGIESALQHSKQQ
jgi:hypothetical protein